MSTQKILAPEHLVSDDTVRDLALVNPYMSAVENIKRGIRSARPDLATGEQATRVSMCRRSILKFAKTYLPNHFDMPFGEHHVDLARAIEAEDSPDEIEARLRAGITREGKRIARIEPREHGKSTFMLVAVPLWWLAYKLKYFIVLFGATEDAVTAHFADLQERIDPSINPDSLLLQDFPHLAPMIDFKGQFVSWTDTKIRLLSGATIVCRGITAKFRGMKEGGRRPDAMVLDDPQDEEDVLTFYRREKLNRRFRKTIMNLGGRECDIIAEGNLMHKESLLAQLVKDRRVWDGKLYKAENLPPKAEEAEFRIGNSKSDGSPLWPEGWTTERLRRKKLEIGRHYAIEFLNEDRGDEEKIYNTGRFMRFDRRQLKLSGFRVIAFWDAATGKKESKDPDFASIAVVATRMLNGKQYRAWLRAIKYPVDEERARMYDEAPQRFYFVLDCFLKRCPAQVQIDAAIDLLERYPITRLFFEDNGAWSILVPEIQARAKERGVAVPLKQFSQSKNKPQRIMNAEPVIHHRTFFAKQLHPLVLAQFGDFPLGHDDAPDSIIAVIEQFEKTGRRVMGFV